MRTNEYVNNIFSKVYRARGEREIDFKFYSESLYNKDKEFMEVFDFITHGVGDLFIAENGFSKKGDNYISMQKSVKLLNIINKVEHLYNVIYNE